MFRFDICAVFDRIRGRLTFLNRLVCGSFGRGEGLFTYGPVLGYTLLRDMRAVLERIGVWV
jgi:hypothetical protein